MESRALTSMGPEAQDEETTCTPLLTGTLLRTPALTRTHSDSTGLHLKRRFTSKNSKRALFTPEYAPAKRQIAEDQVVRTSQKPLVEILNAEPLKENEPPIATTLFCRSLSSPASAQPFEVYTPVLPLTKSTKHPDLNVISPSTVKLLLDGAFDNELHSYHLVDCRFQHEYTGGSIRGSISLTLPRDVEEYFFQKPTAASTRTALIFFCEFSAQRAPKMARHVRSLDRKIHADCYPQLHYPELYIIDGGYKNFFETVKECCHPPNYIPMAHEDYADECKRELSALRANWKQLRTPLTKQTKWC